MSIDDEVCNTGMNHQKRRWRRRWRWRWRRRRRNISDASNISDDNNNLVGWMLCTCRSWGQRRWFSRWRWRAASGGVLSSARKDTLALFIAARKLWYTHDSLQACSCVWIWPRTILSHLFLYDVQCKVERLSSALIDCRHCWCLICKSIKNVLHCLCLLLLGKIGIGHCYFVPLQLRHWCIVALPHCAKKTILSNHASIILTLPFCHDWLTQLLVQSNWPTLLENKNDDHAEWPCAIQCMSYNLQCLSNCVLLLCITSIAPEYNF